MVSYLFSHLRDHVPRVVVLLTDGQQTRSGNFIEPSVAILPLKKIGVKVFAVGIGRGADRSELESIADSVQMLPDFNKLNDHNFIAKYTYGCNAGMTKICCKHRRNSGGGDLGAINNYHFKIKTIIKVQLISDRVFV